MKFVGKRADSYALKCKRCTEMLYPLYEYLIRRKLDAGLFPRELCFMTSEADLLADPGRVETVVH